MRRKFWEKRIPTLLGIILIFFGVAITTLLVGQGSILVTNASPTQQPKNVRITDVTGSSFTVSFTTDSSVTGSLSYGTSPTVGQSALDVRDQQSVSAHRIHYINVTGLNPQTKYFFTIISGQDTYMNNNQPFAVTTGPVIPGQPNQLNSLAGKVILPRGVPPQEAIVYLTLNNSQVISSLVKPDGTYTLQLSGLRTNDLSAYYQLLNNESVKLLAYGDGLTSNVILSSTQTSIPVITLSNDYNFTQNQNPSASTSAGLASFPSLSSTSSASQTPKILSPQKDQGFTDQQPLFKGTALPGKSVQIIIHSAQEVQSNTTTDTSGYWSYRPPAPLAPGNHTITITTVNASGLLTTLTQSFIVYASGTQVSQSATPSATLTPTVTPSPTIIVYATQIPTPTPTASVVTDLSQTPTPTEILAPTGTGTTTGTGTESATVSPKILPPTGNPFIITLGIAGIIISLLGGLLFLLSRGGIQTI